jgi:hypothetical protein
MANISNHLLENRCVNTRNSSPSVHKGAFQQKSYLLGVWVVVLQGGGGSGVLETEPRALNLALHQGAIPLTCIFVLFCYWVLVLVLGIELAVLIYTELVLILEATHFPQDLPLLC